MIGNIKAFTFYSKNLQRSTTRTVCFSEEKILLTICVCGNSGNVVRRVNIMCVP